MGLLGMPRRIPAVRQVYSMPPTYYDPSDPVGHPILVIAVDAAVKIAQVVTRTTKAHAKGECGIAHPPQSELKLLDYGWWRISYPRAVPYMAFAEPDVVHCGELDEQTWAKIVRQLGGGVR